MTKYVVALVNEIPPGQRKIVEAAGRSIGVFNLNGEFFALRNRCPHQGGPLCQGRLSGRLIAPVPGQYDYNNSGEMLRCPWHGWEFEVKTGQSWFDPAQIRVRRYPVTVETPSAALEKGPYLAETYPVAVEEEFVVVEIGP
jgi:3-phenylpropionate/trans-cinnamate dioxygenase ferredoxin subunit